MPFTNSLTFTFEALAIFTRESTDGDSIPRSVSIRAQTFADFEVELQTLEQTAVLSASQLPENATIFYSAAHSG